MRVIVLGAGIVGVTSAYQLAKAGHTVTVVDRQKGPSLETSFANAGEVSFGYCSPWAAPGIPMKALKWLLMEHAPLILRPKIDRAMLSWLVKMLSNCTSERYAINKSRMLRLADYSRISLAALRKETAIDYDQRMQGTLQLFRTQAQLDASGKDVKALAADGIPYEVLDRDACVRAEPALAHVREKIVGGLLTEGRNRRLLQIRQRAGQEGRAAWRSVLLGCGDKGPGYRGRSCPRCCHELGNGTSRRGRCGTWQLLPVASETPRHQASSLSGQRLLSDDPYD
ncbi:FAD-dependent oxidoreductase [Sinorhizobium meliloti]|nr:FAD-dependent oxidoreductase [Sinorhizobium meliloti]MDX0352397.1 FAD-dependent oxidoreductase [Sinorhizobium meliloti]